MIVSKVIQILEELCPLKDAEDFDNVGLLVGDYQQEIKGILVTLDTLEDVVDEAIAKNCNLIISFHPIIFKGLKKINGNNYVERVVMKAIRHQIAIFAMHTALDNAQNGVNGKICDILGILNRKSLIPKKNSLIQLTTYVPQAESDAVRSAMFAAGAGHIGNYSHCSFNTEGVGTYLGNENSNPTKGERGQLHREKETRISLNFPKRIQAKVVSALIDAHPYEEVAYELKAIENDHPVIGMGMIGELEEAMKASDFLTLVKEKMQCGVIRHSELLGKPIQRVAVLGGSGAYAIRNAIGAKADIFLTADLKYHDFFQTENKIVLADIGHYESEQYTKNLLVEYLTKKIPNFAVCLSEKKTNPIQYF
ncbi:MAG: Nif3-like dinuclear metal center hexameric protein [Flavobacteriaceae bacterium]|nr:Nif3-like dinuclear metal center hexameric protein [Flavobacteriaceae bacterium]